MGRIIVRIWEGLGNQLFQYAFARGLKEKGYDVRLDLNKAYDDAFEKDPRHDIRQNSIQNFNITLPEINVEEYGKYQYIERNNLKEQVIFNMAKHGLWKYGFYEEELHKGIAPQYSSKLFCIKGDYYIKGWFQDERYFKQIRRELLEELTPKKRIRISEELVEALKYKESVSLHVRRGDYVRTQKTLDVQYYWNAITWMRKQYKEPLFLIFSEDFDWVRNVLGIKKNCIYVNEDRKLQDYEELLIMSRCKSNIIANSTFSWWGAWLNRNPEKIVIAPRGGRVEQKRMIQL